MPSDFIAMVGEFVGTVLFMIFALGGTKSVPLVPLSKSKRRASRC